MAARGRLMQALPTGGAMVALEAGEAEVAGELSDRASVASVNGPESVVIAGDEAEVLRMESQFADRGRRTSRLRVSHAFHSPLMEPMLDEFEQVLRGLSWNKPRIPVVSTLTGELADGRRSAPRPTGCVRSGRRSASPTACVGWRRWAYTHWWRSDRTGRWPRWRSRPAPSPSPPSPRCAGPTVLRTPRCCQRSPGCSSGASPLRGERCSPVPVRASGAADVCVSACAVLARRSGIGRGCGGAGLASADHPLLGAMVALPESGGMLFTGRMSVRSHPWLADHVVRGWWCFRDRFRGAGGSGGDAVGCGQVGELVLEAPLVIPARAAARSRSYSPSASRKLGCRDPRPARRRRRVETPRHRPAHRPRSHGRRL
ncbi:acyltransferase domain-containing protein [Streptomyces sp. M19]